ncbi:hypothetical protein Trydic_g855 [Trypoxylus dichotomus]
MSPNAVATDSINNNDGTLEDNISCCDSALNFCQNIIVEETELITAAVLAIRQYTGTTLCTHKHVSNTHLRQPQFILPICLYWEEIEDGCLRS